MTERPHHLDVRGLVCPLPILMSVREIRRLAPGDLLEVVGDDPTMLEDFPVWCERSGNRLVEIDEIGGLIRCRIERGAPKTPAATAAST